MDWRTFKTKFEKRLNLQDPNYLEIIFATALAHRIPGDPVWLFWISQSGGGKTEVLRTFQKVPDTKYVESVSDKTFISHFHSKEDKSLIRLLDKKCLIIKDFTTIMSLRPEIRAKVFADFRAAYDGFVSSHSGLGGKEYQVKFGVLAGVTPIIEEKRTLQTALGERFLFLKTITEKEKRKDKIRASMVYSTMQHKMREELKELTADMMASASTNVNFHVGKDQGEWFVRMAEILAQMRAHVPRDSYRRQDIIDEPKMELATRIVAQLMRLFQALRILVEKDDALRATARIVKDSIPSTRAKMVEYAYKNKKLNITDYPSVLSYNTLRLHADDLVALGVFSREGDSESYIYRLEKDLVDDVAGLFGGEKELRKQRPGMWE